MSIERTYLLRHFGKPHGRTSIGVRPPLFVSRRIPMGNSSYTLQQLVDIARAMGDIAPVLPTGGAYQTVALAAANDAMTAMIAGSSKGSPFNFKFNRLIVPPFFVNSYQQDYVSPLVNLGWLESCGAWNTSSTQYPKPFRVVEVKRDVLITSAQTGGNSAKISWMENDTLTFGTWGQSQITSLTGIQNPTAGAVYKDPTGLTAMPTNPITQVKDSAGNLWFVTGYGTCGAFNPFTPVSTAVVITSGTITVTAPNGLQAGEKVTGSGFQTLTALNGLLLTVLTASPTGFTALTTLGDGTDTAGTFNIVPQFPLATNTALRATTVTDGTVIWTSVNPKGQGFRLNPMPSQTGPVWQIAPIGQMKIPRFTSLGQYLEPIPDDYFTYFQDGFFTQCYRRSPDPKVRAKFKDEYQTWMKALDDAVRQGSREQDDWGFVPTSNVMDTGWSLNQVTPAYPYGPWCN
jgi:hypothetical protein